MNGSEELADKKNVKSAEHRPVVVLVGQTPPPYTGQAVMIQVLLEGLKGRFHVEFVRMDYSTSIGEVGRLKTKKLLKLFQLIHRTRALLKQHPSAVLYYPPAPPALIPVFRDIIFLLCVRRTAARTAYHYHAYGLAAFLAGHPWLGRIAGCAYGKADFAVVPTQSCKEATCLPAVRCAVVPYGIELPGSGGHRSERNDGILRILFVGIHTEGKGIFELVETIARLSGKGIPVECRCVGSWADESEQRRIEQLVIQKGLQEIIKFRGCRIGDALWSEYLWADVFFFPTRYRLETQGMVVVEAMAFHLPVVASRWHGPQDVIEDRQTGILCPPGSVESYTKALMALYFDADLRKQMGVAGRLRYETFYTEKMFIEKWVSLITGLYEPDRNLRD